MIKNGLRGKLDAARRPSLDDCFCDSAACLRYFPHVDAPYVNWPSVNAHFAYGFSGFADESNGKEVGER